MSLDSTINNLSSKLSDSEFADLMAQLDLCKSGSALAVAVSGGPDSLCLALLLSNWARKRHHQLTGLIVDHQLRPESTLEAQHATRQLSTIGVPAVILPWYGIKPKSRLQETARQKRYQLLIDWCQQQHCSYLFTGHHLQDQQETATMRLWRGSDLLGLAGMSAQTDHNDVMICRPLLSTPKQRLESTIKQTPLQTVQDPSNHNQRFLRVAIRHKAAQLPALPLAALGQLRQHLEVWRTNFIRSTVTISPYGYLTLDRKAFQPLSLPFQQLILSHLIAVIGNNAYTVNRERLTRTIQILTIDGVTKNMTTQGGCILYNHQDKIFIIREWKNCQKIPINCSASTSTLTWDGRFVLNLYTTQLKVVDQPLKIDCLGEKGWQQVCQSHPAISSQLAAIPYYARLALPVIWQNHKIVALCHFSNLITENYFSMMNIEFKPARSLFPFVFKVMNSDS